MTPALVVSAHVAGLAVVRGLAQAGIPVVVAVYDHRDMGSASRYVQRSVTVPHPERQEGDFVAALTSLGRQFPGSVLFPADDASLSAVSRRRADLAPSFTVASEGWETVKKVISKQYTYELAERIGVPAPHTFCPQTREQAVAYAGQLGYPCLVKPCESHLFFDLFHKKMTRVENRDELVCAFDEAHAAGLPVLVQELVQGGDDCGINYNCLILEDEVVAEFTAQKVRLSPPAFGVPRVVVSKNIPEVIEFGRAILKGLRYNGFACVEFKRDQRTGEYKLMEVNARHNRSGALAIRCGINFPLLQYEYLTRQRRPARQAFDEGVYWIDDLKDLVDNIRYRPLERYTFADLLRPYRGPAVFAVFDRHDPGPLLKRCRDVLARLPSTLGARKPPR